MESFTRTENGINNQDAINGMTGPRRAGYVFAGWATVKDGEVVYAAADVASAPVGTVLYAVYTEGEEPTPSEPSEEESTTDTSAETAA